MADHTTSDDTVHDLTTRVDQRMERTIDELMALARIPSCAFPGFPPEPVRDAALAVADMLKDAGCVRAELIDMGDNSPAVYAEAPGPEGAPIVLMYAHYDVQPAGDPAAWTSPAFEPQIRDGRVYGRGAADDKSGVAMHIATIAAFDGTPPCTVRVIIEGDEEYGGSFEEFPRRHPEMFQADAIIIADNGNIRTGQPTFTTALRGVSVVEVTVETLEAPVHSGLYGGPAPDALMALITMLASLRDSAGDTAVEGVPGFDWHGAEFDEDEFRANAGILPDQPLVGTGTLTSRLVSRPAVNVIGLDAPPVDGAINAVVPRARAKVSLRVPPNVDPEEGQRALIAHLRAHTPWGVHATFEPGTTGLGYAADTSAQAYGTMARAMAASTGKDAVFAGTGGSIPLVAALAEVAPGATILLTGAQDDLAAIHAPNESVAISEVRDCALSQVLFLQFLADEAAAGSATVGNS